MHTKTFIGVSLMMLLATLSLLAISARLNNEPGIVIGEITPVEEKNSDELDVVGEVAVVVHGECCFIC